MRDHAVMHEPWGLPSLVRTRLAAAVAANHARSSHCGTLQGGRRVMAFLMPHQRAPKAR